MIKLVFYLILAAGIYAFLGFLFVIALALNKQAGCGEINNDLAIGMIFGPLSLIGANFLDALATCGAKVVAANHGGFTVYFASAKFLPLAVRPPLQRPRFHLLYPTTFIAGKEAASTRELRNLNRAAPLASFALVFVSLALCIILSGRKEAALFVTIAQFLLLSCGTVFFQSILSPKTQDGFWARERLIRISPEVLARGYWETWFYYETMLQPVEEVRRRVSQLNPSADTFSKAASLVLNTHLDILDGRDAEALDRLREHHDWLMTYPSEFDVAGMCLSVYAGLEAGLGENRAASDAIYAVAVAHSPDLPAADALRFAAAGDAEAAEARARVALQRLRDSKVPIMAGMEALIKRSIRPMPTI